MFSMRNGHNDETAILGIVRAKFPDIVSIRICPLRFFTMLLRKINDGLSDIVNGCRSKLLFTTYHRPISSDDLVEMLVNSTQVLVMGPFGVQLRSRFQSHALLVPKERDSKTT